MEGNIHLSNTALEHGAFSFSTPLHLLSRGAVSLLEPVCWFTLLLGILFHFSPYFQHLYAAAPEVSFELVGLCVLALPLVSVAHRTTSLHSTRDLHGIARLAREHNGAENDCDLL